MRLGTSRISHTSQQRAGRQSPSIELGVILRLPEPPARITMFAQCVLGGGGRRRISNFADRVRPARAIVVKNARTRSSHFEILRPSFAADSCRGQSAVNLAAASAAQDDTSRFERSSAASAKDDSNRVIPRTFSLLRTSHTFQQRGSASRKVESRRDLYPCA